MTFACTNWHRRRLPVHGSMRFHAQLRRGCSCRALAHGGEAETLAPSSARECVGDGPSLVSAPNQLDSALAKILPRHDVACLHLVSRRIAGVPVGAAHFMRRGSSPRCVLVRSAPHLRSIDDRALPCENSRTRGPRLPAVCAAIDRRYDVSMSESLRLTNRLLRWVSESR